ncbi:hypothetical protein DIPPA_19624 [Diplonema papillatum]|nr:hypothetical protein DIPPA_19624 [Diplonema papillatum]
MTPSAPSVIAALRTTRKINQSPDFVGELVRQAAEKQRALAVKKRRRAAKAPAPAARPRARKAAPKPAAKKAGPAKAGAKRVAAAPKAKPKTKKPAPKAKAKPKAKRGQGTGSGTGVSNPSVRNSESFGGSGGMVFTDALSLAGTEVRSIRIRAGQFVDQISITLSSGATLSHGGHGGMEKSLDLHPGEHLTTAEVCLDFIRQGIAPVISAASFTTNLGRYIENGLKTTSRRTWKAETGWQISGFHGRSGALIDSIGVLYTKLAK